MKRLTAAACLTAATLVAGAALAQGAPPDLKGTWKGTSEAVILGGNAHNQPPATEPRFTGQAFTITIDRQEGRRFSGTFVSERSKEPIVGVIARDGRIFFVDDEGYTTGTMSSTGRMDVCWMLASKAIQGASCVEFVKQP